ncbi:MAG: 2-oxoacid:acceptor oxidoreductase family protein [Nanoarchaeota archaeon]|nr:2-oxoacid:acceptor oxidoreductase family protein [Nanoarchaeota archaeon]
MRLNILIGGKAGQGINKVSQIISSIMTKYGYFIFNYREYPSLIRGGHNFNILSFSDKQIGSIESKIDCIIALDDKTIDIHKNDLKNNGFIIGCTEYCDIGRNANIAQAGALIKSLGIPKENLVSEIIKEFGKDNKETVQAAENGYNSKETKYNLKELAHNKIDIMTGSSAISQGAINSGINIYFGYPMTPATGVLQELGTRETEGKHMVFLSENEIAVINHALGASFAGAKVMIGTSGGGFDLMTEALSMQGMSEIPLVIYLASRPGPGTGIPTFSCQSDLDVALRGGHGEFPRVVIAPGDPIECIEKTNEAFYLSEKYGTASIILSDKHLAESEFSFDRKPNKIIPIEIKRKIPGETIVKASSYEHDKNGNTTEYPEIAKNAAINRIKKYNDMKNECEKKFEMIKIHGKIDSKNLIISWGSNKTVILDSIEGLDYKFLQVIYMKPLSNKIREEIKKAKKVILIENNVTGQLGRLIREKTGIKIENRLLKFDGRPFSSDKLKEEIQKIK